jgi:addiction module RelE/StbE family toxin
MIIHFHRRFKKHYHKLPISLRNKVDKVIVLFREDPFTPSLRNHGLDGSLIGRRSISVTGDIRIIYEMEGEHAVVLFLDVGTHAQVYE